MNRLDDSITDLKKAVEIEPRNPSAHNNLGLSYFELAVHDEAIKCFTEGMFVFFCMYFFVCISLNWHTPFPKNTFIPSAFFWY